MTDSADLTSRSSDPVRNEFSGQARDVVQVGVLNGPLFIDVLPPVAVVSGPPEPREVPALRSGFVNRVSELNKWSEIIQAEERHPLLILCSGMHGIGKSSLIKKFVQENRARFSGGDLYVDFADYSHRGGASISDAVASCLRSLGVANEAIPDSLGERTRLFRSRTAQKPFMIVLEDVGEPAQVAALVPNSAGSVVLASSGRLLEELRFSHGAHLTELRPLSALDSRVLLAELCGPKRINDGTPATDQLIEYSGGLPAALQLLASRLLREETLTPAELAEELADETRRLDGFRLTSNLSISAILNSSYGALSDSAQHAYRRLGAANLTNFSIAICEELAEPAGAGSNVAADLLAYGLALPDGATGYRFHDLVRLHSNYLGTRAEESSQIADLGAVRTLIRAFATTAGIADRLIMGERMRFASEPGESRLATLESAAESLEWFETQRPNLMAVLRVAYGHGWNTEAWYLAEGLTAFFLNHRYLADWLESATIGAAAARTDGRVDVQARFLLLSSRPLVQLGRNDEAVRVVERARLMAERVGDTRLLASAWEFYGRLIESTDDEAAVSTFTTCRRLNESIGEARGATLADFYRAMCLHRLGRSQQARDILQSCAKAFSSLGDARMTARVMASEALVSASLGRSDEAVRELQSAIRIFAERDLQHYEAQSLEDLADLQVAEGQGSEAIACLLRASEIYERSGSARAELLRNRIAKWNGSASTTTG